MSLFVPKYQGNPVLAATNTTSTVSLGVLPAAFDVLFFTILTFTGGSNPSPSGFAISDDGGGVWKERAPFTTQGGSATYQSWYKIATGSETTLTYTISGGVTALTIWTLLDTFGGADGVPTPDPNWSPGGSKVFTVLGSATGSGSSPSSGQSPIQAGLSHQANELIYVTGAQSRGITHPAWNSNSPRFAFTGFLNEADSGGTPRVYNLTSAYCISSGQFSAPSGSSPGDTLWEGWTGSKPSITDAIAFYDPGVASMTAAPSRKLIITGKPKMSLALRTVGKFSLSETFQFLGQAVDGAIITAYRQGRFSRPPVQGDFPPGGGPDGGPVTSSAAAFGSTGRYIVDVDVIDDYFVAGFFNGTYFWAPMAAGMIFGRPTTDVQINTSTSLVGALNPGNPTPGVSPLAAAADHGHDPGSAYQTVGEIHIGAGAGVLERVLVGPRGYVLISDGTTLRPQAPGSVVHIADTVLTANTTLDQPGVYVADATGGPFDITFPDPTDPDTIPGEYTIKRRDASVPFPTTGQPFVRFLVEGGYTFDGAPQWGCIHNKDVCTVVPDASNAEYMVLHEPVSLGSLFLNAARRLAVYEYPVAGGGPNGGIVNYPSPGPYGGATILATNGQAGANWAAIIQVGPGGTNDFVFHGFDRSGAVIVHGLSGLSGSCVIAAVGQLDRGSGTGWPPGVLRHWNNLSSFWPATAVASPWNVPTDLAPNQALVVANGSTILTGSSGSIGFDSRRQLIDGQYNLNGGQPEPPYDGRYACCSFVVPPSGAVKSKMTVDFQTGVDAGHGGNAWGGFGFLPGVSYDQQCVQDLTPFLGGAAHAFNPNNQFTRLIKEDLGIATNVGGNVVGLPVGHPGWLYWMVYTVGGGSIYGDGLYYNLENIPGVMTLDHVADGGNLIGGV